MSRSKRFVSGVSLGYTYQGLVMVVGLWLTPFMLRRIGQHDYGLWLVGSQILSYLMMLDFGIVALLPRETAYATGRAQGVVSEARDLPKIVGETARVVLTQMPVVLLAVLLVWFLMPRAWYGFRGPITIALMAFTVMFPLRIFQAVLEGLQDLKFIGRIQILIWTLSTGTMILLVLAGSGLYSLAIGWSAGQLTSAGIMFLRVRSKFPSVLPHRLPKLDGGKLFSHLSRGFWVSLSQVAQVLVNGIDVLVIGKVLGPSAVVPYACTAKLINVLSNQPNLIMQVAMPGLSELKTGESSERILSVTTALGQAVLMLSGMLTIVVLVVNQGFVTWWVGPKQYGGALLTVLLTVTVMLRHFNTTVSYATFCLGHERRYSIAILADGLVTAGACMLLVPLLGPIGAPLGSILGGAGMNLPLNLTVLCREVGSSVQTVLAPLWPWFWRFVILATSAIAIGRLYPSLNLVQAAVAAILAALVYAAVMFHPGQHSILGSYLRPRILPWWRRLSHAR
jgi:O-antigen/teichoic acid export membrane protein